MKGHAVDEFFEWVSTWAVMINKPSDIGYDNGGFDLPPINYYQHTVKSKIDDGHLFPQMASTLSERRNARRESLDERCRLAAEISTGSKDPWLYWCDLNQESDYLEKYVENSVEIKGSDKNEIKESMLIGFSNGKHQKIITKPKIAQFGMNWQHCNNMVFVGLSDSFEAFYQAVRRCWRFGQKNPVNVHIVISEKEGNVVDNIKAKEFAAKEMQMQMVKHMANLSMAEINNTEKTTIKYESKKEMEVPNWLLNNNLAKIG
ncbi:MAG TPA: helicase-related protein [Bacteroidales bacterium]|nr:helicase-related protein [Bacteroidales bacterium]